MSALDRPRLHFRGTMAVSTPTANNNNYDLVVEPQQATLYPRFLAMSDAQFRQAMKSLVLKNLSIVNMGIAQVLESNWNYYGDNSVVWKDTAITAYDPPTGGRITAGDPILGQPVALLGNTWGDQPTPAIIVDIDPTSDFSSQIFAAQLAVGGGGPGLTATTSATAALPRAHSRWLDLTRNPAVFPDATFAATWQLALPNATLAFTATGSPAIAALAEAAAAGLGLVVRFATYYFNRTFTDPELAQRFALGETVLNQSIGVVLGTIAPWLPGEWGSVPDGRRLNPGAVLTNPVPDVFVSTFQLAPATAKVIGDTVALDLIAAFRDQLVPPPPLDAPMPPASALTKLDLGAAALEVVDAAGLAHSIGPVPYDAATYLAGAGVVELPIPDGLGPTIASGTLRLVAAGTPTVPVPGPLLVETPLVAESDDRATYLTAGASQSIAVQVRARGVVPSGPVPVMIQQYRSLEILPASPDGTQAVPAKLTVPVTRPWSDRKPAGAGDDPANPYAVVTVDPQGGMTDADGTLRLTLTGVDPGMCILVFAPDGANPPPPDLNGFATAWADLYFVHVRVLPSDAHLDAIPDDEVTWDRVYAEVLRYFYKLYPVMDAHLPLNDQAACERAATMLAMLTDASAWGSTLYMPITRELSDGKRRLLQRWIARVQRGETT
jgi:hypothetical protein